MSSPVECGRRRSCLWETADETDLPDRLLGRHGRLPFDLRRPLPPLCPGDGGGTQVRPTRRGADGAPFDGPRVGRTLCCPAPVRRGVAGIDSLSGVEWSNFARGGGGRTIGGSFSAQSSPGVGPSYARGTDNRGVYLPLGGQTSPGISLGVAPEQRTGPPRNALVVSVRS